MPILRFLARELKDYDGQTNLEKWIVDAVSDIYVDWRVSYTVSFLLDQQLTEFFQAQWVAQLKGVSEEYKNNYVAEYHRIISHFYSQRGGPFLLGDKITYVDFAVYQSLDNDQKIGTLPVCDLSF